MAAASSVQGLQEEATCSICLEYYRDPVSTKCGHNFCRACITECSEGSGGALTCPQCRELCPLGDLRPIRQLQSIVELVKQLSVQLERPPGEGLCEEHDERLKLYCEEDQRLICVICREAKEHKQHTVRPLKEAAQEYKSKLQDWLPTLRTEMEGLLRMKLEEEEDCRALRKGLEAERIKIVTEFEKLQQLLKEQEQSLLARLDEMGKKITTVENAKSTEISSLEDLMTEIERKCEQPAGEFLKDFRSTLSRCEHVPIQTLEGIRKKYKGPVTLDADTAHAQLTLSEAGRRVTDTGRVQNRPQHPKRFTGWHLCVLGRGGLTSGRRYWELEILQDRGWAVGVAQESLSRDRGLTHCPQVGVWAVRRSEGGVYTALTSPRTPLTAPSQPPRTLGVYLDYEGGRVSVYDASAKKLLYTFSGASFTGRLCPYLRLCDLWGGTDLRLV